MKQAAMFVVHVLIAMIAAMVVGGLMCVAVNSWLGKAKKSLARCPL